MSIAILTAATALFGLLTTLVSAKAKTVQHDDRTVQTIVDEHVASLRPTMPETPSARKAPSRWRVRS